MVQGVVRQLDAHVVAEFIVGGIEKIVVRALDEGHAIDVARLSRELGVLVSNGLLLEARPDASPRRPRGASAAQRRGRS
jgi:hypothetical protein